MTKPEIALVLVVCWLCLGVLSALLQILVLGKRECYRVQLDQWGPRVWNPTWFWISTVVMGPFMGMIIVLHLPWLVGSRREPGKQD